MVLSLQLGGGECTLTNSTLTFNFNWTKSFTLREYTLDYFIYPIKYKGNYPRLNAYWTSNNLGFKIEESSGYDGRNFDQIIQRISYPINTWRRYTVSVENKNIVRFFTDGKLCAVANSAGSMINNLFFDIGGNDPWVSGGSYTNCKIKRLSIYSKPITKEFSVNQSFDPEYNNLYEDEYDLYGYKKE